MPVNRLKHISGPGTVFATTTVWDWKPLLSDHTVARIVVGVLDEVTSRFDVTVFGYVIMSTHVHMLVHLTELRALSRFMQTFKSLSTRKVTGVLSYDLGTLWKRRFDDLIIVSEEQFITKLRYIHNNPVKAGLVAAAADWEIQCVVYVFVHQVEFDPPPHSLYFVEYPGRNQVIPKGHTSGKEVVMRIGFIILAVLTLIWTLFARPIVRWKLAVYRRIGMPSWADFFEKIFDPWCTGVTIVAAILTVLFALIGFRVIDW